LRSSAADGLFYADLAASVLYANAWLRADPSVLASNHQGQADLWRYAISGDLPIVLLSIADPANLESARRLVQADAYWRQFGLDVDLVILTAQRDVGGPDLQPQIEALIAACGQAERIDKPGGIFVRKLDQVAPADRILLQAVARIALSDDDGPLAQQLERGRSKPPFGSVAAVAPGSVGQTRARSELPPAPTESPLVLGNGLGGFTPDGREYVMTIAAGQMTPVPWVNVLANPSFGTLVSESGSANTWSENAQEFRLTPWSNDPVGDANTEAFYLRDEASGCYWSPTLLPSAGPTPYVTRHGFGYSVFEHSENGIDSELTVFVAIDAPVKFMVLKLCNRSGGERRLSATGYLEWVLGDERTKTAMHVGTEIDAGGGALFAQNPYHTDFAGRTAFFDVDGAQLPGASVCGDRCAFLGHHGTLRHPAAMMDPRLCGAVGLALDPCGAIRVAFTLAAGQKHELVFRLGAGATREEASALVQRWRGPAAAREALAEVTRYWTHTLGAVQVQTPDHSLDVLLNGWLLYQTLACRLWARNAFYQSSGAFGFRDQLQDVMALVHAAPTLVREHLLRCASRQFPQGDVQHWWHPPSGRGVRTRCSDDYLWLPLAVCRYVVVTGDTGVLDEQVQFLEGRPLKDHEASYYDLPTRSDQTGSLYQHCVRAIDHGLRFGVHGLPLMGAGDWNDGMNLVGAGGQGESVWLGFFLCSVLTQFGAVAQRYGDATLAQRCATKGAALRADIEKSAWDGQWYRRGWFDDGSPLGTSANAECRIDSIAQSWAVLSGAGDPQRVRQAMDAVDAQLVHRDSALIQLLNPPFDHSDPSPGYIQGYVPGVRENGGQYTHAAVWTAMAFAALGDARRAWELFTMIDPIKHADSPQAIATYQTEPYVVASDVYSLAPHTGRGGWTWYTGSAGWMLRFILESLLGLKVESDRLRIVPCLPAHWDSYEVNYRYRKTLYRIRVLQTTVENGGSHLTVDGAELPGSTIPLTDDGGEHAVVVRIQKTGA
jgi:cellobiose phosphorylase